MGKGIIKANNGGGGYTVEIVFDRTRIEAELVLLAENRQTLVDKLYTGTPEQDDILRLQIASIDKRVEYINEKAPDNVQVNINCVDFTDDIELEAEVGTIEIARSVDQTWKTTDPENPYLYTSGYWIRPGYTDGAAYNATRDGILNPTINQSPAGVFYNLAMLPGAQKWEPRYRRGVITNLNGDYCDLTLTDLVYLTDDRTEIDIDQTLGLISVPIEYMDCNGTAFEVDDAVVVEFTGQDWNVPKVIGFYSAPQECIETSYYSVLFQKYINDFIPTLTSQVYEKKYLKISADGTMEWVDQTEAAAQCIIDDCFSATKQRPFSGLFLWDDEVYTNRPDIICESSFLNEDGKEVPYDYGIFTAIYSSGHPYAKPKSYNTIYTVLNLKLNIYDSYLALIIATKAGTYVFLKNNIRKVETETYTVETSGSYYVDATEQWKEAVSRRIGGDAYLCRTYALTGIVGLGYVPPVSNGAYISGSGYSDGLLSIWHDISVSRPEYNTYWADLDLFYTPGSETVRIYSNSNWTWSGAVPAGAHASSVIAYWIGVRDGTVEPDPTANDFTIYSTPSQPRIGGSVYEYSDWSVFYCPCYSGPIIVPSAFRNLGNETLTHKCTGGLPTCTNKWTRETINDDGDLVIQNVARFPSAGEHYTEGDDIDNYLTYYYDYCGKSGEAISNIYYSLDEDFPDRIYLTVNYSQTNDDGDGYVNKYILATISRATGQITDSSVNVGSGTGLVDITGTGQSVYTEFLEQSALTAALSAKATEIGAYNANVCRLMRK